MCWSRGFRWCWCNCSFSLSLATQGAFVIFAGLKQQQHVHNRFSSAAAAAERYKWTCAAPLHIVSTIYVHIWCEHGKHMVTKVGSLFVRNSSGFPTIWILGPKSNKIVVLGTLIKLNGSNSFAMPGHISSMHIMHICIVNVPMCRSVRYDILYIIMYRMYIV